MQPSSRDENTKNLFTVAYVTPHEAPQTFLGECKIELRRQSQTSTDSTSLLRIPGTPATVCTIATSSLSPKYDRRKDNCSTLPAQPTHDERLLQLVAEEVESRPIS